MGNRSRAGGLLEDSVFSLRVLKSQSSKVWADSTATERAGAVLPKHVVKIARACSITRNSSKSFSNLISDGADRQRLTETAASRSQEYLINLKPPASQVIFIFSRTRPHLRSACNCHSPRNVISESEDGHSDRGADGIDRCDVCGDAAEDAGELYFCQACQGLTFCSGCWKAQAEHKTGKKSMPSEPLQTAATLHEKTKLSTINLVRPAFSNSADSDTIEARLAEDAQAAWFGEFCNICPLICFPAKRAIT